MTQLALGAPKRPSRFSQADKILRILERKGKATAAEIHQEVGPCRLNSRIADLRKHGYLISCERVTGTGPGAYLYTLEGTVQL